MRKAMLLFFGLFLLASATIYGQNTVTVDFKSGDIELGASFQEVSRAFEGMPFTMTHNGEVQTPIVEISDGVFGAYHFKFESGFLKCYTLFMDGRNIQAVYQNIYAGFSEIYEPHGFGIFLKPDGTFVTIELGTVLKLTYYAE